MKRINWQEDKQCVPVLTNHSTYFRKEKDGYVSVMDPLSKTANYLLLNRTAIDFLENIDGEKNISQLLELYLQKYNSVNKKAVEMDLSNIIIKLWKKNLITWKGEYPGMKALTKRISNISELRVVFENDYNIIKNILANEDKEIKYTNPYLKINPDSQNILIRKRLFDMTSVHILKSDCVGEGKFDSSLMIVSSFPGKMDVITIDQLVGNKDDVKVLLEKSESLLKAASVCDYVKVRIYVNREDHELRTVLENSNGYWELEAVLEKEFENKDYFAYVHFV